MSVSLVMQTVGTSKNGTGFDRIPFSLEMSEPFDRCLSRS